MTTAAGATLPAYSNIYFARSDSVIDGCSVYEARRRAGTILAEAHPAAADVVIGVPDSGIDAAIGYSQRSGIPYGIGFLKNKYIGRTFISPEQKMREDRVKIKLKPISQALKGKSVVVVDDSIVRGTTSARIVRLIRDAGAREIHMRISSPPFMHPCYYGTDIGSRDALIACRHTLDEIRKIIGADTLGYLPADRLGDLIGKSEGCGYCHACFSGVYPTDRPKHPQKQIRTQNEAPQNKKRFRQKRSAFFLLFLT